MTTRFLRIALTGLLLLAMLVVGGAQPARATTTAWWNGDYEYRHSLTITTSDAIASAYSVSITFDHAGMVSAGTSLASGNDVRVAYWNGSAWTELDRLVDPTSSWNNSATKLWFKTQAAISGSTTNTDYYLYYGNSSAGAPPANGANVFTIYDDFSSGTIDAGKWGTLTRPGVTVSAASGELVISGTSQSGTEYNYSGLSTATTYGAGFKMESSFAITSQSNTSERYYKAAFGPDDSRIVVYSNNSTTKRLAYFSGSWVDVGATTLQGNTLGYQRMGASINSAGTLTHWENGAAMATRSVGTGNATNYFTFSANSLGQSFSVKYDNIWIRKYVANEPSVASTSVESRKDAVVSVVVDPALVFSVSSHSGACNGAAQSGDVSVSGAAVNLGRVSSATTKVAAQDVYVGTNASSGFTVYARSSGALNDGLGHTIADLAGATNGGPIAFPAAGTAAFGYTTSDATLGTGTADRFTNGGPYWAAFTTGDAEVFSEPSPAQSTICVGYQLGVAASTPAGTYSTTVVYTAIPTF